MTTPRALTVHPVPAMGAEDVLLGSDGSVWTGTAEGTIWCLPDGDGPARAVGNTGGRPLGLEWLPEGHLLVCDADKGLLRMDIGSGEVDPLVTEVGGVPLRFTNNAAVAADGTIWFSDSSRHWGVHEWKSDLIEHTCSGRLLRRGSDGVVTTVVDGLAFANGVALAADESSVFVAETALRRIRRVPLDPATGASLGPARAWVCDLPGYPDNIARGTDGLIWVSIASPPDPTLGLLQRGPRLARAAALRLPEALKPAPKRTVRVLAYDVSGALVHDLGADPSEWHMATGVREADGVVWLGSLVQPAVASLRL